MAETILMAGAVVCAIASFVFLEFYRINTTSRELLALREAILLMQREIQQLREVLEANEKDHFVMRQMVDQAIQARKRATQ